MWFKTIFSALTVYITISSVKGHSLSKLHLSNADASDTYKVQEDRSTNTIQFTHPETDIPTLREIVYYHIIETPFLGSHTKDIEGPDFDDTTRPFTNAHGMPDPIHREDTEKNIIDKESDSEDDFVTSSDEKLDNLDNIKVVEEKNDEIDEESALKSIDIKDNEGKVTDNVTEGASEALIGVQVIINEDQAEIEENMNTTEETAVLEDKEIEGDTVLTEMELILNEDGETEAKTEPIQEHSIEETTEHLEMLENNPQEEEPRDVSVATTLKEIEDIDDKTIDIIEINEPTTPKSVPEHVEESGTTKREIGGSKVNAVKEQNRNTELLRGRRSKLFGSPEQLKERAMKMKNIMPSVKIREPEVNRRRKREATDDIPEGPTLPDLDYSTLPEYVRTLISTTEKPPATISTENSKPVEESMDISLSPEMQDRLKNILNQIKPLLAKSDSASKNDKEINSDNYQIENIFKGKTFGMNLNSGRGTVWNDIINDNGSLVNFGDSIPEGAQEHLNFYHDEAYSDEDDIRREIIKRIQEIFANSDKKDTAASTTEVIKDDGEVNTEIPKAIVDRKHEEIKERSDKVDDENIQETVENEAILENADKVDHSPDKHEEIVPKLITNSDDSIILEDNISSSDNYDNNDKEHEKIADFDIVTPVEIQGRTFGMNLTAGEGVVWNDLFTKPGVRINFGDETTDEQPDEDNKSEQLEPFDAATTGIVDDDDIYVKVDKKKPLNEPKDVTIQDKSQQEAENSHKNDSIDSNSEDSKKIDAQNDEKKPGINNQVKSDIDLALINDVIATVIGIKNEKDKEETELHTNRDGDDKEKFWRWMTEWTTAYTQLLTRFLDRKINDAISDLRASLKPDSNSNTTTITENPEEIDMTAEKDPDETIEIKDEGEIPVNNTNLLRRRKDKDHKKKDTETNKGNSTENSTLKENIPNVNATTIYGNAVGNNKVTNIFVFLTERNASLNFVQDIIKDGDKIIGDGIKPSAEDKEDISANEEQFKPEVLTESTENLRTKSPEDIEDKEAVSENIQEPTEPITNKVNNEISNHENNTTIENKDEENSSEIMSESDKELVTLDEKERDNSEIDTTESLPELAKEDIATTTEVPKTNAVGIDEINDNITVKKDIDENTEVPEEVELNEDSTTNAEQSEATTNAVFDERITDDNNMSTVDTLSKENSEKIATTTDVINVNVENPNVNVTDVQIGGTDNENNEVTTELLDIETTTDSIKSDTLE